MSRRRLLASARIAFGILTLAAIGTQLVIQVRSGSSVADFFSYFSILSNLFASIVFLIGGLGLIRRRPPSRLEALIRGAPVVAMVVVGLFGLVFWSANAGHLQPWVDRVLHVVMPVAVVLDWLVQPPRPAPRFAQAVVWLAYPLAYLAWVLIHGSIAGGFPHKYLDAGRVGSSGVAIHTVGILGAFLGIGCLMSALAGRLRPIVE